MRTRSGSPHVIEAILKTLTDHPYGLTLRELSRKSKVPLTTLRFYLDRDLSLFVYDDRVGPSNKPFARLIRPKWTGETKNLKLLEKILEDEK